MKITLCFLILAFMISACGSTIDKTETRTFIPGVYVKEINHEFATGMDTLIIESIEGAEGKYSIIRKSSYQQTIDGRKLTPKSEEHKWLATFDEVSGQLKEQSKGRVFTVLPKQNTVSMGSSEYRKVNK